MGPCLEVSLAEDCSFGLFQYIIVFFLLYGVSRLPTDELNVVVPLLRSSFFEHFITTELMIILLVYKFV